MIGIPSQRGEPLEQTGLQSESPEQDWKRQSPLESHVPRQLAISVVHGRPDGENSQGLVSESICVPHAPPLHSIAVTDRVSVPEVGHSPEVGVQSLHGPSTRAPHSMPSVGIVQLSLIVFGLGRQRLLTQL